MVVSSFILQLNVESAIMTARVAELHPDERFQPSEMGVSSIN